MPARHDLVTDPAIVAGLARARLAQAYFSRRLNELADEDFAGPSLVPGWSRAHVIADVGYQARALTRLIDGALEGAIVPMHESEAARLHEVELGATLATRALRHLSDHAAITLDVAWRDLPEELWAFEVRDQSGHRMPIAETVWLRTHALWLRSIELANGGRAEDAPPEIARRI